MAKDTGPSKVVHHNPEATDSDKRKALDEAMSRMEKNFGKGAVMRLGDKTHMEVDTTPTGSLSLDVAWAAVCRAVVWWRFSVRKAAEKPR
jgi:recombination protein RecA